MSRGDGTDVHFHDEHQILYASRGLLSVTTDKGVWLTPGARAVWIPAGTPHQHNAFGALTIHTVGLPDVPNPAGVNSTSVVTINRLARDIIMELSEVSNPGDAAAQRLRWVLLDQLTRSVEFPLRVRRPHDPRLILISEAIEQDPQGVSSLDDAARLISVSSRTMSRLCQADLGMTFPQWRTQLRLHRALELLADGWSVTDVAVHCGWSTASSFIDVFRRTLGYTPGRRTTAA
ncbi:MAG TPA: AraC family transcriptional regulator, partial [Pseudolysinimonas sp.]|nr:AraC family transcriptional regulator [Pseudolysinimonas sp.]